MLTGIHFLLTYMCNLECDHCFLYCGPNAKGTFTISQIIEVLDEVTKIGTIEWTCFEGGEPFLYYPIMLESVRIAHDMGFKTAIETNSYWATSVENARLWLVPLREAGLSKLEISDDSFHDGEEKDNPAKRALSAAKELGMSAGSICIDRPGVGMGQRRVKGEPIFIGGPKLRGRAVKKLIEGLPRKCWEKFAECPLEDLRDPKRVHVDSYGNVHLCQGLSMGNMWETPFSVLIRNYSADSHPICRYLVRGGPALLAKEYNLEHEDTYVDTCHFCSMICLALVDRFPQYLAPKQVYGLE
jgi:hypothetical protein